MKLYPLMKNYEKYGLSAELNDPSGMPDIQQVGIMVMLGRVHGASSAAGVGHEVKSNEKG